MEFIDNLKIIASYLADEDQHFEDYVMEKLGDSKYEEFNKIVALNEVIKWIEENNMTDHIFYNFLILEQDLANTQL